MARITKFAKAFKTVVEDVPTTQLHLPSVISRTTCERHEAPFGSHCFEFQNAETETWHYGVCNSRALKAGMNGRIHPSSLDRTYSYTNRTRA